LGLFGVIPAGCGVEPRQIGFVSHVFVLSRQNLPAGRARLGSFRTFSPPGAPACLSAGLNWVCLAHSRPLGGWGLPHRFLPVGANWVRFARLVAAVLCPRAQIGFVSHIFTLRGPGRPAARTELGSFRTFHSSGEPAELELWNDGGHREFEVRARRLTLQRTGHGQLLCRHRGPRENHQSSIQRLPPTAFWLSRCLCD
jgi:hypothetical protein